MLGRWPGATADETRRQAAGLLCRRACRPVEAINSVALRIACMASP